MLKGITSIMYKEVFHILRDPRTLFLMLLVPAIDLSMFGYAIDLEVKDIPTAVYNLDGRQDSREFLDMFANSGYFNLTRTAQSDAELEQLIVRGKVKVGIKIAPDFSDHLLRGQSGQVQILLDGSDSTVAMQALNVANAIALRKSISIISDSLPTPSEFPIDAQPRVLFNPDLKTPVFMIPGLVGITMQMVTILLTAFSIVREREMGTLEQLMVTPVSRLGLLLGKLLPFAVVGILETAFALLIMRYLFGVHIAGSLTLLSFFALIFIFTSLGLGLFISTMAHNQMEAVQMAFVLMLPSVILSGFMFPQDNMPAPIYAFCQIIPTTYWIRILRGIILRGAGFMDLWQEGAMMGGLGILVLIVATARFRKSL